MSKNAQPSRRPVRNEPVRNEQAHILRRARLALYSLFPARGVVRARVSRPVRTLLSFVFLCMLAMGGCLNDPGNQGDAAAPELDCSSPRPGCSCEAEGSAVVCGHTVESADPTQIMCGRGVSHCSKGVYGACEIDRTEPLALPSGSSPDGSSAPVSGSSPDGSSPNGSSHPGATPQTLGDRTKCSEPCDPYCGTWNDDPINEVGNNVVEGGGGLTLPGTGAAKPCGGGTSGTCEHTICEPGGPLTPECDGGPAVPISKPVVKQCFYESFADNSKGWTMDTEWQIGPAAYSFWSYFGTTGDPPTDASPGDDNGVAGVVIGGNLAVTVAHDFRWLTSPVVDTSAWNQGLMLTFNRKLMAWPGDYTPHKIEVFDGTQWVGVWESEQWQFERDDNWTPIEIDVFEYRNPKFQMRFGHKIPQWVADMATSWNWFIDYLGSPSWNLDDVALTCTYNPDPGSVKKLFTEDCSGNNQGWKLEPQWEIGPAVQSNWWYGPADPATDTTPTADNGVCGVVIGGNFTILPPHDFYWFTSPVIDTKGYGEQLTLKYKRKLQAMPAYYFPHAMQVFDGSDWVTVWQNPEWEYTVDSDWKTMKHDVSAYANANFKIRYGWKVPDMWGESWWAQYAAQYAPPSWSIDDIQVTGIPNYTTVTEVPFKENFANNKAGWTMEGEWQVGPAITSNWWYGEADPAMDTTATADNRLAGIVIGGSAKIVPHDYHWLTSPAVDITKYNIKLELRYKRKLQSLPGYYFGHAIDVYDGTSWVRLWSSGEFDSYDSLDKSWTSKTHDLMQFKSKNFRVRWGMQVPDMWGESWWANYAAQYEPPSWSIDDVSVVGSFDPTVATDECFNEPFADNSKGWTLEPQWQIGPAVQSNWWYGKADPGTDTTATNDNGLAGVVIGGNSNVLPPHDYYWMTSPIINTEKYDKKLAVNFKRTLQTLPAYYFPHSFQVFNGSSWTEIWKNPQWEYVTDHYWTNVAYDVSKFAGPNFRMRFGWKVPDMWGESWWAQYAEQYAQPSWSLDDIKLSCSFTDETVIGGSAVTKVCAIDPTCCTVAWKQNCIDLIKTATMDPFGNNVTCECTTDGQYIGCYKDPFDHDLDGYSGIKGDCKDCDKVINAGAYDYPKDLRDNDCSGVVDDESNLCDAGLALTSANPLDHAKALGLCRTTVEKTYGQGKTWGVITDPAYGKLTQADGVSAPNSLSYGLMSQFGKNNLPNQGDRLAVYSTGTARYPGQANYIAPDASAGSYSQGTSCSYPTGYPIAALGCPNANGSAFDSSGVYLKIRVPTNAKSLSYNLQYFSADYPEQVCASVDDAFVALLGSKGVNGNITYDAKKNPISVNNAFFTLPGCSNPANCSAPELASTGFDGTCLGKHCGGSTGWLTTMAPVTPGETMTMQFAIWDSGNRISDSSILLDGWQWSPLTTMVVKTIVGTEPPWGALEEGFYVRDYDASNACPIGSKIKWTDWTWTTTTADDSFIDFRVSTATTFKGLAAAPSDPILFTKVPGPFALVGQNTKASTALTTNKGGAYVDTTLATNARPRSLPHLRITSRLVPSTNNKFAPVLLGWNMKFSCSADQ